MIFLTVGNWHKGFDRLVEAVDRLKSLNVIIEDVIAQVGSGAYRPTHLKAIDYCSPTEFAEIMTKSRMIISHAGIGTIGQAIELAKPIIVVPRKAALSEHNDNHQWTTAKQLEQEGKILVAYDVSELPKKLEEAKNFNLAKEQNDKMILRTVKTFLEKLVAKKCRC